MPLDTALLPGDATTLYAQICRVDEEKREVWGIASTESIGTDGKILGFEGTIKAFAGWPGNIREQHNRNLAVGRMVHWEPLPDKRAILLGGYISRGAESTWQKVLDGTLKYWSVKGPLKSGVMRSFNVGGVQRAVPYITEWLMEEASLVDRPGDLGVTQFTIVRSADGFSALDVTPAEPFVVDDTTRATINSLLTAERQQSPIAFALPEPAPALPFGAEVSRAGTTKSEGDAGDFPASDYAYVPDPDKPSTWKLRLTAKPGGAPDSGMVGAAAAALGPKGYRGNKAEIPSADRSKVVAKVRAAWKKANPDKEASDMPDGIVERAADAAHEAGDIAKAQQVIALIRELIGSEAGEVVAGDSNDTYQIGGLACALQDLQSFIAGEAYEQVMAQRSAAWEEQHMTTTEELLKLMAEQQKAIAGIGTVVSGLVERMGLGGTATIDPPAAVPAPDPITTTTPLPAAVAAPAAPVVAPPAPVAAVPAPPAPVAPPAATAPAPAAPQMISVADLTAQMVAAASGAPAPATPTPTEPSPPPGVTAEQWASVERSLGLPPGQQVDLPRVIVGLVERMDRYAQQPATPRPVLRTEGLAVDKLFPGDKVPVEPAQVERAFTDIAETARDPAVRERAQLGAVVEMIRGVRRDTHTRLAGG